MNCCKRKDWECGLQICKKIAEAHLLQKWKEKEYVSQTCQEAQSE